MSALDLARAASAHVAQPDEFEEPLLAAIIKEAARACDVASAWIDLRTDDNPAPQGGGLFAAAPLVDPDEGCAGTLCVSDPAPRDLTHAQADALDGLALIAGHALAQSRRWRRALHDAEQRSRAMIDTQPDMVSLSRVDGTLLHVNPAYARFFGLLPATMAGTSLYGHVDPDHRDTVRDVLRQVLDSGRPSCTENRMVAADGSERWVRWTNAPHTDALRQRLVHSTGRDITQQKHAEQALRASQVFLERTGRVAGVGGWELDLVHGRLTWSSQTRRIHEVGDDFEPSLDRAITFYTPEARPRIESAVARSIIDGRPWDLELQLVTARGRTIWVRAVGEAEFENGRAVRLLGAFQDIDERRRLQQQLAEDSRFLRKLADQLPLRIGYLDRERRYRFVNRELLRHLGHDRADVIGRTRAELRPDADDAPLAERARAALAGHAQNFEFEEVIEGRVRRFENRLVPDRDDGGEVRGFFVTGIDITERHAAEREAQRQTAILRSVSEAIPATVVVVGTDGTYRFANSAFERYCGLPRERILGRRAADVLGAAEVDRRRPYMQRAFRGESVHFTLDYPPGVGTTHLALSCIPLVLESGGVDGLVGISQDITHQKREEERLLQLAQRDPLTGLLNRAGFEAAMAVLRQSSQAGLAVLYIDLDDFKPINDTHGHPVGDQVLLHFGRRLTALFRPSDVVARIGGDEFAVGLGHMRELAHAQAVADKVVAAAREPVAVGALSLHVGASVGLAYSRDPLVMWRDLLTQADAQLLRAKMAGKGRRL